MTKSLSILNEMTVDHDKFYIDQFFLHISILRCHNVSCQSCVAYVYDENQIWRCTRNYSRAILLSLYNFRRTSESLARQRTMETSHITFYSTPLAL